MTKLRTRIADLEAALLDVRDENDVEAILLRGVSGRVGGREWPDDDVAAVRDGQGKLTFRRAHEGVDALVHRAAGAAAAHGRAVHVLMAIYAPPRDAA